MNLFNIVPLGRSFGDYRAMFALSDADLQGLVLGCGDGPAGFNAEATASRLQVISVGPIYVYSAAEIETRVFASHGAMISQVRPQSQRSVWEWYADPEAFDEARQMALQRFLVDYEIGKQSGRYVPASLPRLPIPDASFDLGLCSHLLFCTRIICRLRITSQPLVNCSELQERSAFFPLLTLLGRALPASFNPMRKAAQGIVGYEFQRGGDVMLRLSRRTP